jgi:hypothetical protein
MICFWRAHYGVEKWGLAQDDQRIESFWPVFELLGFAHNCNPKDHKIAVPICRLQGEIEPQAGYDMRLRGVEAAC